MPPKIYRYIYDKVHTALRQRFQIAASPIESPGKTSHGDLDVLVCWDTAGHFNDCASHADIRKRLDTGGQLKKITELIGATHALIERKHNATCQLAVPWPDTPETQAAKGDRGPPFAQIDLHICPSREYLEWELFQYSHGDIFWFLHTMVRPFGLTLGTEGLQLRIEEIENETVDHSLLLSRDPTTILKFLGFQPETEDWERPFPSNQSLFEFASRCRFFFDFTEENISEADKGRMQSRAVYRKWVTEFIPQCRQQGIFPQHPPSRSQIRDEVSDFFLTPQPFRLSSADKHLSMFPSIQEAYSARILAFKKDKQIDLFARVIQPCVYEHVPKVRSVNWLGNISRAFEDIIMKDDDKYRIRPPKPLKTPEGLYLEPDIREFIQAF